MYEFNEGGKSRLIPWHKKRCDDIQKVVGWLTTQGMNGRLTMTRNGLEVVVGPMQDQ